MKQSPVLFGSGIPMLARAVPTVGLELIASRDCPSGHRLLEFALGR